MGREVRALVLVSLGMMAVCLSLIPPYNFTNIIAVISGLYALGLAVYVAMGRE